LAVGLAEGAHGRVGDLLAVVGVEVERLEQVDRRRPTEPVVLAVEEDGVDVADRAAHLRERAAAGEAQRPDDPVRVDLRGPGVPDGPGEAPRARERDEGLARARGEQLGVGEPRRAGLRPEVHDDDTDRPGTGQRTSPDLVHARHEAGPVAEDMPLLAPVRSASSSRRPSRRAAPGGTGPCVDRVEGHGSTSGTSANTSPGLRRRPRCDSGHTLTNAVPTTLPIGTNPPPGLPVLYRESAEFCRLSPMTNSMSSGTVRSNSSWLGTEPGLM